ncbi:hypothetical protein [Pararhodobacter sp.]|uniref:hypothetical protein n=1 Tax=Pararhodobacter sp. TaxID=2127056 RepID=UPI002AFEFC1F|nr:hypothetical protein [Pararhodobacter sp.]
MKPVFISLGLVATMLVGCSEFTRASRYALDPITSDDRQFEVFMLVRSVNPEYTDPRQDPEATTAVYVTVAPGRVIYCGATASGCHDVVRRFRNHETSLVEDMVDLTNRGGM